MDAAFSTGSVIGKKSDTKWAQVIKTPYAYGVIEVGDETGNAQTAGMALIHEITNALSEPIHQISDVSALIDSVWQPTIQALILCVPLGSTMTVIVRGVGTVYLKRDGHMARLRSSEGIVSGAVYPNDILFLASKTCLNGVSEEEFFSFFDHLSIEDVAEKLTLHLHTKNENCGYAGLFIEAHGDTPQPARSKEYLALEQKEEKIAVSKSHNWNAWHIGRERVKPWVHALRTVDTRISVLLFTLFFISITIGILKESSGRKTTETTKSIQEIQRLYDEGVALLDLNLVKSRERLTEAKHLVDTMKPGVSQKSKEGRELRDLEQKLKEVLPKATQEYEAAPELFFDVSLLKNGSAIESFALYEDTMVFLDTHAKTVYSLQLSAKNGQVVGGGSAFDGSETVAVHGDTVYVFTPNGINTVSIRDKTVQPLVIKKAVEWVSIKAMTSFGGNIYLLDTGPSRIWKYVATGSAFSPLREYLLPDFFPDLSKATTMAIDGSVWVSLSDGTIKKFTQGRDDPFIINGVEPEFGKNVNVFTDDTCAYIYVLDRDNKRVVSLEKDGMYRAQYRYPSAFTPTSIAASEKLGKLFFFSEGKLYTTALK